MIVQRKIPNDYPEYRYKFRVMIGEKAYVNNHQVATYQNTEIVRTLNIIIEVL
jgi:hypothetical protein